MSDVPATRDDRDTLLAGEPNPALTEDAAVIYRDASRLNRLVDDILLVDRVDACHMSLKMLSFDVNRLIRDMVATFRPPTDSQQFPLDLDPSLRTIEGDRDWLSQAITNLVSNAVKYSPNGRDGDDHHTQRRC
jgi:signal transduction histidine kinase